jgi:hypothetical protein
MQQQFVPQQAMAPRQELTGGQKAGFFFMGFFGTIVAIFAASLCNIGKPYRSEATKFTVIGCVVCVALIILLYVLMFVFLGTLLGSAMHSTYSSYGSYGSYY